MPTGDPHGDVVLRAALALGNYTENSDYGVVRTGEPGYRLDREPDTVRAPDVAWIAPGRIPEGAQGYPEFAPDLVVEVKSPSNSNAEIAAKAAMWLCYGSRQAWVLDPQDTTVTIHRPNVEPAVLTEGDVIDGGDLLPGFTSPVWRLFRRRR
jgi:Uma2 family endonuclease